MLAFVSGVVRPRDNTSASPALLGIMMGYTSESQALMEGEWRNGSWAELVKVPAENVNLLNELVLTKRLGYAIEDLGYIITLAVAYGGLSDICMKTGEAVIVAPATGKFGSAAVYVALAMGARKVIAMGRNQEKLRRVIAGTGDRVVSVPITGNIENDAAALQIHGPIDVYFDISPKLESTPSYLRSAFIALRPKGRVSLMGSIRSDVELPYLMMVIKGLRVQGTFMYTRQQADELIGLVESGLLPLAKPGGIETSGQTSQLPEAPACLSDVYTIKPNDTCDSLALKYIVSSAEIFINNPDIFDCYNMVEDVSVCLPFQCNTYEVKENDTCISVADSLGLRPRDIVALNPWIDDDCHNFLSGTITLGRIICTTPSDGQYSHTVNNTESDPAYSKYADEAVPLPKDAILAENTTKEYGHWYTIQKEDDCVQLLGQHYVSLSLFTATNPSISPGNCTMSLIPGQTYCVGPTKKVLRKPFTPPRYWRLGCYSSGIDPTKSTRVLILDKLSHVKPMSILACKAYCLSQSLRFFGLQNGDSCLCDDRLRMDSRRIHHWSCKSRCSGGPEFCGREQDTIEVFSSYEETGVEYTSIGCFVSKEERVIPGNDYITWENINLEEYASFSTVDLENDYFALQEDNLCVCGNESNPRATKVSIEECDIECTGENMDTCGGKDRAKVYTTNSNRVISSSLSKDIYLFFFS
ncbi:hypothetical protein FOZG_08048 [Fusarium oxysporum Fo47]|uniref:LysM domain-containing protein n=1 Tax=Fusarium oxysporum Fo47 TaxID=660027 RepID=W9KG48_FUSOX|nr:hypothetical protein FOZG_08048 [Fusarium oxysporum Fo47]